MKSGDIIADEDDLRAEYDPLELNGDVRGKHLARYRADPLFRITIETYNRMGELGLIGPSDRVELLDGLLVSKMTKGPRHVTATHRAFKTLLARLPDDILELSLDGQAIGGLLVADFLA